MTVPESSNNRDEPEVIEQLGTLQIIRGQSGAVTTRIFDRVVGEWIDAAPIGLEDTKIQSPEDSE